MAYVTALHPPDALYPIDLETSIVGEPIRMEGAARAPFGIVIAPDGRFAYVTNTPTFIGPSDWGGLTRIDLRTGEVGPTVEVNVMPQRAALTPDGEYALTAREYGNTVVPVRTDVFEVQTPISLGSNASDAVVAPDGKTAYATTPDAVVPIALDTMEVGEAIPLMASLGTRRSHRTARPST